MSEECRGNSGEKNNETLCSDMKKKNSQMLPGKYFSIFPSRVIKSELLSLAFAIIAS